MQGTSGSFRSSDSNLLFSKAITAYESAKNFYAEGKYQNAYATAQQAGSLLELAKQTDAEYVPPSSSPASSDSQPCPVAFALLAVLALAFWRRAE